MVKESYLGCREHIELRSIFRAAEDRRFFEFYAFSLALVRSHGTDEHDFVGIHRRTGPLHRRHVRQPLTLNGLMVVVFQYPVTRMLQRVTKKTALILGSCFYAVGYFTMSFVGAYPVALAAMAVVTTGEMTISPTTLSVVGELSPPTWRGRYMGFYGLSETIGVSTGPLLGGILLDGFPHGRASIWGVIAGAAILAAIGFSLWKPYKVSGKRVG